MRLRFSGNRTLFEEADVVTVMGDITTDDLVTIAHKLKDHDYVAGPSMMHLVLTTSDTQEIEKVIGIFNNIKNSKNTQF